MSGPGDKKPEEVAEEIMNSDGIEEVIADAGPGEDLTAGTEEYEEEVEELDFGDGDDTESDGDVEISDDAGDENEY